MTWTNSKKALVVGIPLLLALIAAMLFVFLGHFSGRFMVSAGRRAVSRHIAVPIDLTRHYAVSASVFEQGNGSSYWTETPWGFQVFNHVPLQMDGMMFLWGQGNAKMGNNFPEEIPGIPVNQKFDALYVYHCAFFSAPRGTPVYELVFRYADDSSVTNEMLYGADVLDFNSNPRGGKVAGPTNPSSKLAWVGSSFSRTRSQPLRFCLSAIKNPQPAVEVASIDLYSSKGQCAGVIFAMTAGPAGMMK